MPVSTKSCSALHRQDYSSSETNDEALYETRSTSESSHEFSSDQHPFAPSDQTSISSEVLDSQSTKHLTSMISADNTSVSELPDNGRGLTAEMTPPLMMRPEAINTDSWIGRSGTLPVLENINAVNSSVFVTVRGNRHGNQSDFFLRADSWDDFYVDAHGTIKHAWNENWDGFYVDANGMIQNAWNRIWDGFYVDG